MAAARNCRFAMRYIYSQSTKLVMLALPLQTLSIKPCFFISENIVKTLLSVVSVMLHIYTSNEMLLCSESILVVHVV